MTSMELWALASYYCRRDPDAVIGHTPFSFSYYQRERHARFVQCQHPSTRQMYHSNGGTTLDMSGCSVCSKDIDGGTEMVNCTLNPQIEKMYCSLSTNACFPTPLSYVVSYAHATIPLKAHTTSLLAPQLLPPLAISSCTKASQSHILKSI